MGENNEGLMAWNHGRPALSEPEDRQVMAAGQSTRPRLSVVIPTHNRRELLETALEALARQTYPASQFEVVVVVDGSEDDTVDMLRGIAVPYRLRFFCQEQSGAARSRNAGIERAVGDVVLCLDDDVIPFPSLIEEHIRRHDADERVAVIGYLSPAASVSRPGWNRWEEDLLEEHFRVLAEMRREATGRDLYSGNFSARRSDLLSVGGFDETMRLVEDGDLGCRLEQIGVHFHFSPRAGGVHCGLRSYDSWRNHCYLYGRMDVVMGRDKAYPGTLARWLAEFHKANVLTRLSVAMCLDRQRFSTLFLGLLRRATLLGDGLGLFWLSKHLYSGIACSAYWQGVGDELGGREGFWREIARHRPPPERANRGYALNNW